MNSQISPAASATAHWLKIRYAIGALGVVAVALTGMRASQVTLASSQAATPPSPVTVDLGVSGMGTLEPRSRIVRLSAPTSPDEARVEQLFVTEGDWVEADAVVATLDVLARREAAFQEASAKVAVAQARLEQVKAGSKPGDISALKACLRRADTDCQNAERELARAEQLLSKRVITSEEFERRRHQLDTTRHDVERAEGLLASAREVREVDVRHAEAEVQSAVATSKRAEVELDAARIRAPFSGRILKVVARPGEQVGDGGVVELGDTSEMHAVAEVYEADVMRVCVGQAARIRVPSLDAQLRGKVASVGHLVGRKVVLDNDPVTDTDARVIEVRIRLNDEDGKRVAGLSNARVHVVIDSSRGDGTCSAH